MSYPDRIAAGRSLGGSLLHLRASDPLVLGLPRGGVPVAAGVRTVLGGDVDVLLVRKLGVPWQPELAMGAIGEGGARVLNEDVLAQSGVTTDQLTAVEDHERAELQRRQQILRGGRPRIPLTDRSVVIVDDGMATGATVAVACEVAALDAPSRLTVAVPVSSVDALERVGELADEVICPLVPRVLGGVGGAYRDFHQLTDAEVVELLSAGSPAAGSPGPGLGDDSFGGDDHRA